MLVAEIDGGWERWSREIYYAAILFTEDGEEIFRAGAAGPRRPGKGSANEAEYLALEALLEGMIDRGLESEEVLVRSDSQLLVRQMKGIWRAKRGKYKAAYSRCRRLVDAQFDGITFEWISRDGNTRAHDLAEVYRDEFQLIPDLDEADRRFLQAIS